MSHAQSLRSATEDAFADALADAIAADAAGHPADGPLVRAVLRWVQIDAPAHFTVHLLGTTEADGASGEEAWLPLEWTNSGRELERTERVAALPAVNEPAAQLAAIYSDDLDRLMEAEDAGEVVDEGPGGGVSRAIWETIRRLPGALQRHGVALDPSFAATAAHFEDFGGLDVLRDTAPPEVLAALEARDELPSE